MNLCFKSLNHIGLSSGTPTCPKISLPTLLDKEAPTDREVNFRYICNRIMARPHYLKWFLLRNHGNCFTDANTHVLWGPSSLKLTITFALFFCPMPPHVLVDFVVLPPGHGGSVTYFYGWDAHEAQLRCPDDVSGDVGRCSARRVLKHKFYQSTQTMVTVEILSFRENSHGRAGKRTRDFMIGSQRL